MCSFALKMCSCVFTVDKRFNCVLKSNYVEIYFALKKEADIMHLIGRGNPSPTEKRTE